MFVLNFDTKNYKILIFKIDKKSKYTRKFAPARRFKNKEAKRFLIEKNISFDWKNRKNNIEKIEKFILN